ncbi:MAG: hypothetical protein ACK55I_37290, partial [bacterium]
MARATALRCKHGHALAGQRAERAIGLPVGAGFHLVQRRHVRGERVQVRTDTGLAVPQRQAAGARRQLRRGHQARSARQLADLHLEILHLVEVAAPVQQALPPGTAAQAHRVAQALA